MPREATNNNGEITLEDARLLITAQRRKINNLELQIEANKIEISSEKAKKEYMSTELRRATSLLVEQQLKTEDLSRKLKFVEYSTSKAIELATAIIGYIEKNRN